VKHAAVMKLIIPASPVNQRVGLPLCAGGAMHQGPQDDNNNLPNSH